MKKDLKTFAERDIKQLENEIAQRAKSLLQFRANLYAGREKNLKRGKILRREIAQISGILSQKRGEKI